MVDPRACSSRGQRSQNEACLSGGRAPLQKGLLVNLDPAIGPHVPNGAVPFVSAILGERLSAPLPSPTALGKDSRTRPLPQALGSSAVGCYVGTGSDALDGNVVWSALPCPPIPPLTSFEVQDPLFTLSPHIQAGARITRCSLQVQTLASLGPQTSRPGHSSHRGRAIQRWGSKPGSRWPPDRLLASCGPRRVRQTSLRLPASVSRSPRLLSCHELVLRDRTGSPCSQGLQRAAR